MNYTEVLTGLIADAIAPIYRRAVKPETTFVEGGDIPARKYPLPNEPRFYHGQRFTPKKPLPPRDRLSARLAVLYALTECKNHVMKDILNDVEAIEDAKRHHVGGLTPEGLLAPGEVL